MSYRCDSCQDVCWHQKVKVVTERHEDGNIKKEQSLCASCALGHGLRVPPKVELSEEKQTITLAASA